MVKELPPRMPEVVATLGETITKILNRDAATSFLNFGEKQAVFNYTPKEYPELHQIRTVFQLKVRFRNPKTRRVEPLNLTLGSRVIKLEIGDFGALDEKLFANLTFGEENFNIRVGLNLLSSKVVFYMFRNNLEEQITAARDVSLEDLGEFEKALNTLVQS